MSTRSRPGFIPALVILLPTVLLSCGVAVLVFYDPSENIALQVPGLDGQPAGRSGAIPRADIGSWYRVLAAEPADEAGGGGWPWFRGETRENTLADTSMDPSWTSLAGAELLWSVKLGEGHAGASVYGNRVYLLDYDEARGMDLLRCFDLRSGTEYRQLGYAHPLKRNHGLSRSIPSVNERFVVTIGPEGHLMCADRQTGVFLWGADLANDWKAKIPPWYTAQCPLLDGDSVVIAPCSPDALLASLDASTGAVRWRTPNPSGWSMSHASIMKAEVSGTVQYVYAAVGGISGVNAETGKLLWQVPWKANVVAPSPVVSGDTVFQTAGYGAGAIVITVGKQGDGWSASVRGEYKPADGLACEQQTPVPFIDPASGRRLLLGIMPNDGGTLRNQLVCADTAGGILWSSGKDLRFGLGPFLLVRDRLLLMADDGELSLLRISENGCELLDRRRVIEGAVDSWAPLALTRDGVLVARDSTTLVCWKLHWEDGL